MLVCERLAVVFGFDSLDLGSGKLSFLLQGYHTLDVALQVVLVQNFSDGENFVVLYTHEPPERVSVPCAYIVVWIDCGFSQIALDKSVSALQQ